MRSELSMSSIRFIYTGPYIIVCNVPKMYFQISDFLLLLVISKYRRWQIDFIEMRASKPFRKNNLKRSEHKEDTNNNTENNYNRTHTRKKKLPPKIFTYSYIFICHSTLIICYSECNTQVEVGKAAEKGEKISSNIGLSCIY